MLRLIEPDFAAARKPYLDDRTPSGFLHLRTLDALLRKCRNLRPKIVTHQIKLGTLILIGRMNCHFRRRQRENQPTMASVHRCKSQNVAQESAVRRSILAVYDHVRSKDHQRRLSQLPRFFHNETIFNSQKSCQAPKQRITASIKEIRVA